MKKLTYALFAFLLIIMAGCGESDMGQAPVPDNYEETINEWKEYRVDVLKGPTDWLRLHGIYWLEEGINSFGSGEDQDFTFPEGSIPDDAGTFRLESGTVTMQVADGVEITHDGEPVTKMVIFDGEERPHLQHEELEWFVDSRGDQHGIRLYNKDNPKADAFDGFPFYPLDETWYLKAQFVPNTDSTTITVDNVLGDRVERYSPGTVLFERDGVRHSLVAFESRSGLFLIFADPTNRTETYQAGRYMIIPFPDEEGNTIIDFNKAYNPPCAFNTYTTCQLPPPQNRLDVAVEAGEKRPVEWEGI